MVLHVADVPAVSDAPGQLADTSEDAHQLEATGHSACLNPTCNYWWSPNRMAEHDELDKLTCPNCQKSYNMWDPSPFGRTNSPDPTGFKPGGMTYAGMPPGGVGDLGEEVVHDMGSIPGYGAITWWHPGPSSSTSPLDGATKDWGIEVKTMCLDAQNHKFVAGGKPSRADKNQAVASAGYKGILAIFVLLDFRRSVADIYLQEQPAGPWMNPASKRMSNGIASYRPDNAMHLVKETPFKNPFLQPDEPAPAVQEQPF